MLNGKAPFVWEGGPVNAFAAGSVALRDVAALNHEVWDEPVKTTPLVMQRLARLVCVLANAQLPASIGRA